GCELIVRRPDGVVLLDPPGLSAAINTAPIFSILLAGNAVVVRRSRSSAQELLVENALAHAGFDVVASVEGRSRDVAAQLLRGRAVDTIVFFGDEAGGAELASDALACGVKFVAELGGSDYLAVWRDGHLGAAIASAQRAWHVSTLPCLV